MTSCSVASLLAAKRSSTERKSEKSSVAMLRAKLSFPSACASDTVSSGSHCELRVCLSPGFASYANFACLRACQTGFAPPSAGHSPTSTSAACALGRMTIFTSAASTLGHLTIASRTLKSDRWTAFTQGLGMTACARA